MTIVSLAEQNLILNMGAVRVMSEDDVRTAPNVLDSGEAGFGALTSNRGNFPLRSVKVSARLLALCSHVTLDQTFLNAFDTPLEATYIFPLPPQAAVTSFRLEVKDRVTEGVIKERGEARQEYAQAVENGFRAAIVEEERQGVFTIRVGNIGLGETASVRLTMAAPIPVSDGEATFRFPLLVAPRYIPGVRLPGADVGLGTQGDTNQAPDASRITPPQRVTLPGFPDPVHLGIEVEFDVNSLPVSNVRCSLHTVTVSDIETNDSPDATSPPIAIRRLRLDPAANARLDRDFILRFSVTVPDHVAADLILSDDLGTESEEGTWQLTLIAPKGAGNGAAITPRDVAFVIDRSGSMEGWKMVAARSAAARVVDTLSDVDRFTVLAFDNAVECPFDNPSPSIFGPHPSGNGLFGPFTVPSAPAFNPAPSHGCIFGGPPSNSSAFGNPPSTTSLFGAPSSNGSAFGNPLSTARACGTPPSTSLFGGTPSSGSAFGNPPWTTSAFGNPTSGTGFFGAAISGGSAFGAPPSTGSAFGNPPSNGPIFGAHHSSGSVFGNPPSNGSSSNIFGGPPSNGNLSANSPSTNSLFGGPSNASVLGNPQPTSVFGTPRSTFSFTPSPGHQAGLVAGNYANRQRACNFLATLRANGGTEMAEPLARAVAALQGSKGLANVEGSGGFWPTRGGDVVRDRVLVLITDGEVGNEDWILGQLAPKMQGIRVFTLGIDQSVNESFLRRLSGLSSGGACELVETQGRLEFAMDRIHRLICTPVLRDICIDGPQGTIPETLTPSRIPGLFPGVPVVVSGRYRKVPETTAFVTVSGKTAAGENGTEIVRARAKPTAAASALWARAHICDLNDCFAIAAAPRAFGEVYASTETPDQLRARILETSLRFQVLSRFTAFVAVDRVTTVPSTAGKVTRLVQRVEPPAGWTNSAPNPFLCFTLQRALNPPQTLFGSAPNPGLNRNSSTFGASPFSSNTAPAFGGSALSGFSPPSYQTFGATSQSTFGASTSPAFAAPVSAQTYGSPSYSAFGATAQSTFGTSSSPAFGSSPFGAVSQSGFGASTSSAFGSSAQKFGGAFGATSPTFSGSPSPFVAPSQSAFGGSASLFGASPNSAFGGSSQSVFGASAPGFGGGFSSALGGSASETSTGVFSAPPPGPGQSTGLTNSGAPGTGSFGSFGAAQPAAPNPGGFGAAATIEPVKASSWGAGSLNPSIPHPLTDFAIPLPDSDPPADVTSLPTAGTGAPPVVGFGGLAAACRGAMNALKANQTSETRGQLLNALKELWGRLEGEEKAWVGTAILVLENVSGNPTLDESIFEALDVVLSRIKNPGSVSA